MSDTPAVLSTQEHGISLSRINEHAIKVLNRLHEAGFRACLVGGGVRDLLLGITPKDFDVATDATPEEVKALFRSARLIGRRFRLAHVRFGREIIEVATFRAPHEEASQEAEALIEENGRILRDNVYGSLEQDVWRRDFTVNSLYFDIADKSIIDYTGGVADLRERVLRLIGNPEQRYREDPVRMLRAIRFAAKLDFAIDAQSEHVIHELAPLIADTSPARLFEEFLKLMHGGVALNTFDLLRQYGLFEHVFPETEAALRADETGGFTAFVRRALQNTDERVLQDKPVNPAFLVAVLLWQPLQWRYASKLEEGLPPYIALHQAGNEVISHQLRWVTIPRRFSTQVREIWELQQRFKRATAGKRAHRLKEHPRFRAAYDFLCLRAQAGEQELADLCEWWTAFQEQHPVPAKKPESNGSRRRRGHRPRRRRSSVAE